VSATTSTSGATVVLGRGPVTEELGFHGGPGERVFAATSRPAGPATGSAVLCPSLFVEHVAGYRQDVCLAARLAEEGVVARRLHYRGTGHSEGEPEALTFDRILTDALAAADRLRGPVAFVGTRLGALVAAAASTERAAPALLFEPCLHFSDFLRDQLRVRRMRELVSPDRQPVPAAELRAQLAAGGSIDVLGYPVTAALAASFDGRSLDTELAGAPRPLLVVAPRSGATVEAIATERRRQGWDVEVVPPWDAADWWMMNDRPEPGRMMLDRLATWVAGAS
jgi:hypothetical protein